MYLAEMQVAVASGWPGYVLSARPRPKSRSLDGVERAVALER
jgi:hypothetical protein